MKTIIFFTAFLFASVLMVANIVKADENSEYAAKARERRYVGGADESDLKVQKAVNSAKTKAEENEDANEGF